MIVPCDCRSASNCNCLVHSASLGVLLASQKCPTDNINTVCTCRGQAVGEEEGKIVQKRCLRKCGSVDVHGQASNVHGQASKGVEYMSELLWVRPATVSCAYIITGSRSQHYVLRNHVMAICDCKKESFNRGLKAHAIWQESEIAGSFSLISADFCLLLYFPVMGIFFLIAGNRYLHLVPPSLNQNLWDAILPVNTVCVAILFTGNQKRTVGRRRAKTCHDVF